MKYKIQTIEERIIALLDENREIIEERTSFADTGASIIDLVKIYLQDAARISICSLPLSRIGECRHYTGGDTVRHLPGGRGSLELPYDFLRLVNIRMEDWEYGVSTPMAFDSDSYRLRAADRTGNRPRHSHPAVAILQFGENKIMNIFGTREGSGIAEFDYLAIPEIDDDIIDLPSGIFSDVCERIAEMIRLTLSKGLDEIK